MALVKCSCGTEFENIVNGQLKMYCSDRCRKRAQRAKDKVVTGRDIEVLPLEKSDEIKSILKYPGAKWSKAEWIVGYLPKHTLYVEPFCGSAAVFMNKTPAEHEVLNDLSSNIVNLFRVIRERGDELAMMIEMTPWSREEYNASYLPCDDPLESARRFVVRCWQAHGTRLNGKTGWRNRGVSSGGSTASLWKQLPGRLLAVVDRLKDAEIEQRPALEVIEKYNAANVLLYVDPPYVLSTRSGELYEHEMLKDQEHIDLLDMLDKHRGPVVLSGYAHPLYDDRLKHWQRVAVPSLAEKGRVRMEVLWLNKKAHNLDKTTHHQTVSLFDEEAM